MAVYGGFKPWKAIKSARLYQIAASYTPSIFKGMPVCRADTGYVIEWQTGVDMVGVALAFFDVNMNPINYWVASTATKGYVLVADDPNQEFVVAEDADTTQLAQTEVFGNVDVILGTGDTVTGVAASLLDSSGAVSDPTTATNAFRIVGLAPIVGNEVYHATRCPNPKWIVVANLHQLTDTTGL